MTVEELYIALGELDFRLEVKVVDSNGNHFKVNGIEICKILNDKEVDYFEPGAKLCAVIV